MKLKQTPEDFHVEELTDVAPTGAGSFSLYRLEKTGWTTPDAIQAIRRRWKLDARRVSYGGLKDRHAHTIQYLTIYRGPERRLTHHGITVEYLGAVNAAYTSHDIRANRFRLVLRALTPADRERAAHALAEVAGAGIPNYFDDQRFGSVSHGGRFIARAIVLGNYEEALRLALAAPYEHDRAAQKKEKAILRAHWNDWASCKQRLPKGHARSIVDYLVSHAADFRGAVERLRPELRGLYLSAYQSHLWNRMLALWLEAHARADQLLKVTLRLGVFPMQRALDEQQRAELRALRLPLPSARVRLEPGAPGAREMEEVLCGEGITLEQMKLKGLRQMFFSKGDRAALCMPEGIGTEAAEDELNKGREKLTLTFEMSRGSYATMLVKRITAARSVIEATG
jgi:tRNA pseudouridine13 synthase